MRSSKPLGLAAMAAAAALTLTACGGGDDGGSGTEGEGGGSGESVRIGIKFDQPGLGFRDGSEYTGFDVDVAKYVAGELGYSEDQIVDIIYEAADKLSNLRELRRVYAVRGEDAGAPAGVAVRRAAVLVRTDRVPAVRVLEEPPARLLRRLHFGEHVGAGVTGNQRDVVVQRVVRGGKRVGPRGERRLCL